MLLAVRTVQSASCRSRPAAREDGAISVIDALAPAPRDIRLNTGALTPHTPGSTSLSLTA